ncbi:MAG: alpha/beta fold hydrolase [Sulfurifustis sp.]
MLTTIQTSQGKFTAEIAGPATGDPVLLLHGFPQSRHSWRHQVPALGAAGYRAVAYDQRGYSPGVRPDPATNLAAYGIDRLIADVLDVAEAVTQNPRARFHLVGHDWGGQVAWGTAASHPDRVASLTVLSRPHPTAFRRAFRDNADNQQHRSRHHQAFNDPATVSRFLADDAGALEQRFSDNGVPASSIAEYLSVVGNPAALEAAVAWYRAARAVVNIEAAPVNVPTLYIWGDVDHTVGPTAARGTAEFVTAAFRFEVLPGVGHFITDQAPEAVTRLLLQHLASYPLR